MEPSLCDFCGIREGVKQWRTGWWLCLLCYDETDKKQDKMMKGDGDDGKEEITKSIVWFT